ncbi:MAG TPA: hypothetical protein VFS02_22490 [Telluria sp.]|nr:hypothetical protein [Telluria sp.]
MTRLTRDQLLAAAKNLPTVSVPCEELGGEVVLTMLTAGSKIDWASAAYPDGKVDMKQYTFGLLSRSMLDDNGAAMFSPEEVATFGDALVLKLHSAASKLNAIGAEAVAETEGKSDAAPATSGDSSSPGDSGIPTPI